MKRAGLPTLRLALTVVIFAGSLAACRTEGTGETSGDTTMRPDATAPTSTETADATKPPLPERLARAPKNCSGPAPRLVGFGDYGNLAGSSPVWAGFYAAFDPPGQRYRIERDAPRTNYGWRVKVLLVAGPKLKLPARIQGREITTGAALLFEIGEESREPHRVGTLDPATPGVPTSERYTEFPSYLYVPQAGCYALEADWAGGRWRLVFGLGS